MKTFPLEPIEKASRDELAASFDAAGDEGQQVRQYFNFLNFVILNNLAMTAWALVGWLPHALNVAGRMAADGVGPAGGMGRSGFADILFLASYQPSSDLCWELMLWLGTATMLLTAPAYYLAAKCLLRDEQAEPEPGAVHEDDRTPHFDRAYPRGEPGTRRLLRVATYAAFVAVCGVPAGVDYGLAFDLTHRKLKPLYEEFAGQYPGAVALPSGDARDLSGSPLVITIIVVAVKAAFDAVFETVAAVLTDLERHATYSAQRFHRILKLLLFRIANTQSLFVVRHFADVPFYPCLAARTGNQALIMILLDLTVSNIAEIGWSAVSNLGKRGKAGGRGAKSASSAAGLRGSEEGAAGLKKGSSAGEEEEEEEESEIELTDDYVELLYRQYVMLLCLGVFPLVTALSLLCNLLEWPLDKLKFVNMSNPVVRGRFHHSAAYLSFFVFFAAVAGFVHFPTGPLWCVYFSPCGYIQRIHLSTKRNIISAIRFLFVLQS